MSSKLYYVAAALGLYAVATAVYFPVAPNHPFTYDESDYMWAGREGLWANYTDRNGLPITEFVQRGLELAKDRTKRASFSQFIRTEGDIGMYRHYHGPVYAYWLAILHDVGVHREDVFRGAGLLIHFATATLILFGFWAAFPRLPAFAGLVACGLFVFSRTTVTAATTITQHLPFTFVCMAVLFSASLFFRRFEVRWFYVMMAMLGISFCTVETSILVVFALAIAMTFQFKRIRERWPTLKSFTILIAKGVGVTIATMFLCWPKGIIQLGAAKGFLTLAYMSIIRKTFSPFGPLDLWKSKFIASPVEFSLLFAGVILAFLLWRKSPHRAELLPWLAFVAVFTLATLKITLEYTYYYAPIVASFVVVTAVVFGILWDRWPAPGRVALTAAVTACAVLMAINYRDVLVHDRKERPYHFAVLQLLRENPVAPGQQLYVPFQLVPTLHYYFPQLATVGYDVDYPVDRLADGVTSTDAAERMLCEEPFCNALAARLPGVTMDRTLLNPAGPNWQPLYVVRMHREARGI